MATDLVQEFTDDNFQGEVLDADRPVLVDFWAEWCMPCRMLTPTIEEIAGEFGDQIKVGKLDTDKAREISVQYKITAIPTVIIFQNGEPKKKFVGLTNAGDLRNALNELVAT